MNRLEQQQHRGTVTGGPGVLHVDSITSVDECNGTRTGLTRTVGNTLPHHRADNEPNLSMEFADWLAGSTFYR